MRLHGSTYRQDGLKGINLLRLANFARAVAPGLLSGVAGALLAMGLAWTLA